MTFNSCPRLEVSISYSKWKYAVPPCRTAYPLEVHLPPTLYHLKRARSPIRPANPEIVDTERRASQQERGIEDTNTACPVHLKGLL